MASRTTDAGIDKSTAPALPEPQANANPEPYAKHFKVRLMRTASIATPEHCCSCEGRVNSLNCLRTGQAGVKVC